MKFSGITGIRKEGRMSVARNEWKRDIEMHYSVTEIKIETTETFQTNVILFVGILKVTEVSSQNNT